MPLTKLNVLKQILLLLGIVCIPLSPIYGQTNKLIWYYENGNKAAVYYHKEKYDSALVYYKAMFTDTNYVHSKYVARALKCAKKVNDKQFVKFIENYKSKQLPINHAYKAKIDSLIIVDNKLIRGKKNQKLLYEYSECATDKNKCDSARFKFLETNNKNSGRIDSLNGAYLISLIKKYGFPSEQLVGAESYFDAHIILLHFDSDKDNAVLGNMLYTALNKGDISPKGYSEIIDRRAYNKGNKLIYYTIPFGEDKLSKTEIEEINKNRVAIGLPKLGEGRIIIKRKKSIRVINLD